MYLIVQPAASTAVDTHVPKVDGVELEVPVDYKSLASLLPSGRLLNATAHMVNYLCNAGSAGAAGFLGHGGQLAAQPEGAP
jgi:hypothetical protein